MRDKILKALGICLLMWMPVRMSAQYATECILTDTPNNQLKESVQATIGKMLTEFNDAYMEERMPELKGLDITDDVKKSIEAMWENAPFRCNETEIIERCLHTLDNNYQVRNIPLFAKGEDDKPEYQEAVVNFNPQGRIINFHLAIDNNLYLRVLKKGQDVTDLRYRQIILDYVEQFRTAYNTKDLPFLDQIFSDDALIITGKVIKAIPTDANNFMSKDMVQYTTQKKAEYLERLGRVFRNNKRIHVAFNEVSVKRHPAKEGFYGVTLKQDYKSDMYSDTGYVFLLWDFTNPEEPKIHVRTWQPEYIDGAKLPEEDIFTCMDFEIK